MTVSIYGLFDPFTGELRYIGKTTNPKKRFATHLCEARKPTNKVHCRRWIAGILLRDRQPEMEVLEEAEAHQADATERYWIAGMRLAGCRLTNRTDGGDGQSKGYKPSAEARARLSKTNTGRKASAEIRARMSAARSTPEEKQKARERVRRLVETNPEWLAKVRVGMLGKKQKEDARQKISASWTPERKALHAAEKSALPFDDRWSNQLQAALAKRWDRDRGKPISKEHREALAMGRKARWDEWRANGRPEIKRNIKNLRRIEYRGENLSMAEWSARTGLKTCTIRARLDIFGWSIEDALSIPRSGKRKLDKAA